MEDKLLTKYQVMRMLNISRKHFELLVSEKQLPVIKITPNKRYVRLSHLNQYLDNRTMNKPHQTPLETVPDKVEPLLKPVFGKYRRDKHEK